MYTIMLFIHSWLRWLVMGLLIVVFLRSLYAWKTGAVYSARDRKWGGILLGCVHLQVLVGVILYFILSPIVRGILQGSGENFMINPALRYWGLEHAVGMLLAAALVQVGRILARQATGDAAKHRRTCIFSGLALFLMLVLMPWPFRAGGIGRPLAPHSPVTAVERLSLIQTSSPSLEKVGDMYGSV